MSTTANFSNQHNTVPQYYSPKASASLLTINDLPVNKYNDIMSKVWPLFENKEYLTENEFVAVANICSIPRYMNIAFFRAIDSIDTTYPPIEKVTYTKFKRGWSLLTKDCKRNDMDHIIYSILKQPGFDFITPDDFLPVLEDIVVNHPALQFLEDNTNFQERYIETVICRIFYEARCPSGKMTMKHFRTSNFTSIIQSVEPAVDLYTIQNLFSYKQFYVLYCKLWSLDSDHDLSLSEDDLSNYNLGTLTHLIVERLMKVGHIAAFNDPETTKLDSGALSSNSTRQKPSNMNYFDFIWFLLSEVDKSTPMAITYWFRCLDTDDDGILSGYELHSFWQDQDMKLKFYGEVASENTIRFVDIMRQMNDLVQPEKPGQFTLKDLKKNKFIAERFFDTFINFDKFQVHDSHQEGSIREQKYFENARCEENNLEPTLLIDDLGFPVLSNWEDYAEFEYDRIILDETYANNSNQNEFDECDSKKTEEMLNSDIEELAAVDSIISSQDEANCTSFDDVVIEEVSDASTIGIGYDIFDTDSSEYSVNTADLCGANDDYSDTSSASSVCTAISFDSSAQPHKVHSTANVYPAKSLETLSSLNNLISFTNNESQ